MRHIPLINNVLTQCGETMIWLTHKRYTHDYISGQLNTICSRMRRDTRRMVIIASVAVVLMAVLQVTYLWEFLYA